MASHFECIGLRLNTVSEFGAFLDRIRENTSVVWLRDPSRRYLLWSPDANINLWIQQTQERGIVGANPHFAGEGRVRARITKLQQNEAHPFDGSFYAWAVSNDAPASEDGAYPFMVDMPDFQRAQESVVPNQIVTLQVAAFAEELTVYASEAEYDAAQDRKPRFATRSFIPSGLFTPDGSKQKDSARAIFTGVVLQAEERTNLDTGLSFYTALVETYGGTYDVVAAPEFGGIATGNVIQGRFWLSGRVVS